MRPPKYLSAQVPHLGSIIMQMSHTNRTLMSKVILSVAIIPGNENQPLTGSHNTLPSVSNAQEQTPGNMVVTSFGCHEISDELQMESLREIENKQPAPMQPSTSETLNLDVSSFRPVQKSVFHNTFMGLFILLIPKVVGCKLDITTKGVDFVG